MKRIAMLFLCGLLVFSTSFSYRVDAFTDVKDSATQTAVDTLVGFKIINGYEDNTFRPGNSITRAEFAKIIIATTKNEVQLSSSANFTDIPETHWARTYINISKNLGIVNGVSQSIFAPEDNITYEQAIKMIVVALGYDMEAKQKGGYPEGYIKIADELGILMSISYSPTDKATRGNIARMVRNALDASFYYIYSDGQSVVREKSQTTLFELHRETLEIEKRMNELPESTEASETDQGADSVG